MKNRMAFIIYLGGERPVIVGAVTEDPRDRDAFNREVAVLRRATATSTDIAIAVTDAHSIFKDGVYKAAVRDVVAWLHGQGRTDAASGVGREFHVDQGSEA